MRKTFVEIASSNFSIDHSYQILLMGSCFAENLTTHFKRSGFHVANDPYGVVFNPLSIAKNLKNILHSKVDENTFINNKDVILSFDANSKTYGLSRNELLEKLRKKTNDFSTKLKGKSVLFITFGTAILYEHPVHGVVANCHKQPSNVFTKRMIIIQEILEAWLPLLEELRNRSIQVVFTVSPVRHSKEGLVENSRSKALLINAVHELCNHSNAFYFPAFEIVMDELRDYAYFKEDGVHPNDIAVNYVWERVKTTFLDHETVKLSEKFEKLVRLFEHRPIHIGSEQNIKFDQERKEKLALFKTEFSSMCYAAFDDFASSPS